MDQMPNEDRPLRTTEDYLTFNQRSGYIHLSLLSDAALPLSAESLQFEFGDEAQLEKSSL